jgi:pilus assembly protein CpaF
MLSEEIEASRAEILPFFLDYDTSLRKEGAVKNTAYSYTAQVDIIAQQTWVVLESRGHVDPDAEPPSYELIGECCREALKQLSERCRFSSGEAEIARQQIVSLVYEEGPLASLYQNVQISDIIVNNYKRIQVVHSGEIRETPVCFRSESEYRYFFRRHIPDPSTWQKSWYEGLLDDTWGTRVTATRRDNDIEVVLRVPRMQGSELTDLLRVRTLPPSLALWLAELVSMRVANILIVGAPRTGKTTLLHALLSLVSQDERVCIVEHIRELGRSLKEHEWFSASLPVEEVIHAIVRKIPERLVVSEVDRPGGVEVFIESAESGFQGIIGSMVAFSAEVALARCGRLLQRAQQLNELSQFYRVVRGVDIVILMGNHQGVPCIMEVWEVVPESAHDPLILLFKMEPDSKGKRVWSLKRENSYWIDALSERGRGIDVGGAIRKAY